MSVFPAAGKAKGRAAACERPAEGVSPAKARGACKAFPTGRLRTPRGCFGGPPSPAKPSSRNKLRVGSEGAAATPRSYGSLGTAGCREDVHLPPLVPGEQFSACLMTLRALCPPQRTPCHPGQALPASGDLHAGWQWGGGPAQPLSPRGVMSDSLPVAGTGASLLMLR